MQRLKVSGAVRPLYGSLGVKGIGKGTVLHRAFLLPSSSLIASVGCDYCAVKLRADWFAVFT